MANPTNTAIGTGTAQVYTGDRTLKALQGVMSNIREDDKIKKADEKARQSAAAKRQQRIEDEISSDYKGIFKDKPWSRDSKGFANKIKEWKDLADKAGRDGYTNPELRKEADDAYIDVQKHVLDSKGNERIATLYHKKMNDPIYADQYTDEQRAAYHRAIMTEDFDMNELDMTFRKDIQPAGFYSDEVWDDGKGLYAVKTVGGENAAGDMSYKTGQKTLDEDAYRARWMDRYQASLGGAGFGKFATAVNDQYGEAAAKAGVDVGEYAFQEDLKKRVKVLDDSNISKSIKDDSGSGETTKKPTANFEYFKDKNENSDGFAISGTTGAASRPMEVTIKKDGKQDKIIGLIPSEVIRTISGTVVRGRVVKNSWEDLTVKEQEEWTEENPDRDPKTEDAFVMKGDVKDVPLTSAVSAKLKAQYGFDAEKNFKEAGSKSSNYTIDGAEYTKEELMGAGWSEEQIKQLK